MGQWPPARRPGARAPAGPWGAVPHARPGQRAPVETAFIVGGGLSEARAAWRRGLPAAQGRRPRSGREREAGRASRRDCPCRPHSFSRERRENGANFFADSETHAPRTAPFIPGSPQRADPGYPPKPPGHAPPLAVAGQGHDGGTSRYSWSARFAGRVPRPSPRPIIAPGAGLAPRLLDEDVAHGAGGGEEEVLPRLPADVALVDQAQVRLVDQRRRLQGLPGRQVGHAGAGQLVQLRADDGQQPLRGRGVASLGGPQQLRDLLDRLGGHGPGNPRKKVGATSPPFSAGKRRTTWPGGRHTWGTPGQVGNQSTWLGGLFARPTSSPVRRRLARWSGSAAGPSPSRPAVSSEPRPPCVLERRKRPMKPRGR
jgi:hypothetical protein